MIGGTATDQWAFSPNKKCCGVSINDLDWDFWTPNQERAKSEKGKVWAGSVDGELRLSATISVEPPSSFAIP